MTFVWEPTTNSIQFVDHFLFAEASTPNTKVGQSKESNAQTSVVTPLYSTEPANLRGMYKSKLLELCHKQSWNQPEYTTVKEGPDHNPRFGATVIVNGIPFKTPDNHCRSSKEATSLAACIALDHLTTSMLTVPQQSQFPSTTSSSSGYCCLINFIFFFQKYIPGGQVKEGRRNRAMFNKDVITTENLSWVCVCVCVCVEEGGIQHNTDM